MQRIFLLINTLKNGGAEKQSIYLYSALNKIFKVEYIVYYGDQVDKRMLRLLEEKVENIDNVLFLQGTHLHKLWNIYHRMRENHCNVCISYLATTNLINGIIGSMARVKVRIGGLRSSRYGYIKLYIQRHLHNKWLSCSVFNNYLGLSRLTEAGFDAEKASVIHNAIEIPAIREKVHETITIISVGRFVDAKDYNTSLNSIRILSRSINTFKYFIIGHGNQLDLIKSAIIEYQIESIVEIVINPENVDEYYRMSDIYLSTSIFEGLSNSIMEAMSFGLPVVATNVGDNKYLIKDGETGFLANVKDSELIASKLEILINDAQLRNTMGARGRQHIIENFSIEKFTQQYIDLIEKLSNEA